MQAVVNDTKLTLPGSRRTTQLQSRYITDCSGWDLRNFCKGMQLVQCISWYIADMTHMHATLTVTATLLNNYCVGKVTPCNSAHIKSLYALMEISQVEQ